MNKRGSGRDIVFFVVAMFGMSVALAIMWIASNEIVGGFRGVEAITGVSEANASLGAFDIIQQRMDYIFALFFIGIFLGMLVTSWLIPSNPIWIIGFFLLGLIAVILAMPVENVWEDLATKNKFSAAAVEMPITNHILSNLPKYTAVFFVLGLIVTFGKPSSRAGVFA